MPGLGRKTLNYFPPYPFLAIKLPTGTLLILPQSHDSFGMRRFQIYRDGHFGHGAGAYELSNLRKLDWHRAAQIRDFYNSLLGGGANRLTDQQLLEWLRREVQSTALAAFWLQDEWMLGAAVIAPEASPVPPPVATPVAQWSVEHKIEAMFAAIPDYLAPAVRAQFEAFLTPRNLALMAGFLAAGVAIQALPVADGVADMLVAALAYAMYGWPGLAAASEFIHAVVEAAHARSQPQIDHAAQKAAGALVVLGDSIFLAKLLTKVTSVASAKLKQNVPPPPRPAPNFGNAMSDDIRGDGLPLRPSQDRLLKDYAAGKTTPENFSKFKTLKATPATSLDESAKDTLLEGGYNDAQIKEVLSSGAVTGTPSYGTNSPFYKIVSKGWPPTLPRANMYVMDQGQLKDLMDKGLINPDTGEMKSLEIKNYMALPCTNQANAIYQGTYTGTDAITGVQGIIAPAQENFTIPGLDESTLNPGTLSMPGGGGQTSLPLTSVTNWSSYP